jgi:hypothetical protein
MSNSGRIWPYAKESCIEGNTMNPLGKPIGNWWFLRASDKKSFNFSIVGKLGATWALTRLGKKSKTNSIGWVTKGIS